MTLSTRATNFLLKSERDSYLLTEADIRQNFLFNEAPVFEPLIDFQLKYGGYIFYAGLVPIKFNLLKGQGGYPQSSNTAIIEFDRSETETPAYYFNCAISDYQMEFFLDEQGIYYEDYEAMASSFDKNIEHLALWDEVNVRDYELVFRDERLKTPNIDKELGLDLIPEASDQYTLWFGNDLIYMKQWQGLITLFVSKQYPNKELLLAL
jgi:hypothetical protein